MTTWQATIAILIYRRARESRAGMAGELKMRRPNTLAAPGQVLGK